MPMRHLLLFAVFCAFAISTPARAADTDWSIGVASAKITPQKPVILAGYAARTKPHESVDLDLYAKAMAFKDAQGNRAVLVTMDLCILPRDVAEPVRKRIADDAKLDLASVVLSVSHSHSAPAVTLGETKPANPATPGATRPVNPASPANIEYTRWLQEQLVDIARKAVADLKPAKLSWGTGVSSFV